MSGINRRDERLDNLNIPGVYDRGDKTYEIPRDKDGNVKMGWVSTPEADRLYQFENYHIDKLGLAVPLELEYSLPWPSRVDGQSVVDAYDQVGGTCVGASGAQATTGRHERRNPGAGEKFDYLALYCKCRSYMNDNKCNTNAGATMQSVGKALKEWGGAQVINGKTQPADVNNGVQSYSWGYNAEAIRIAIAAGIYVQIGISIYEAFLSPKLINGEWWVYWQTGSWGSMLGGHAMMTPWWSDSRDAFWLPNTWGGSWCDGRGLWLSRASFTKLLQAAQPAEILLCIDRVPGPQGKLERMSFAINPAAPVVGNNVELALTVKNTGDAPLTGYSLAIEELHDGAGTDGYDNCPTFDLAPGATFTYAPVKNAIEAGTWRWWPDVKKNGYQHLGDALTISVSGNPPPPPPPPADTIVYTEETLTTQDGKTYSTKMDQPNGITYRKKVT